MHIRNNTPQLLHSSHTLSRKQPQQGGFMTSFAVIVVIIIALLMLVAYVIKLDKVITTKFEGKRWDIPAKVYSQPLDLYQGANLTHKEIQQWLDLLNYHANNSYKQSGNYLKEGNTYYIHTRGFNYGDSEDRAQVIKLSLASGYINNIQSTLPNQTGIVRLEPITIGGIYPDNNEDRVIVQLDDVPQSLIDALLATEDRKFYQHKGVSVRGIGRALVANVTGGKRQGGSTITQQLIKNFYLNSERTFKRKANEAIMAMLLELHYSKDEILQAYLNEINLGQNGNRSINGFGLAAQFYFNQPLKELSTDQVAFLVGLAKGPSQYNPWRNPEAAVNRRNVVLKNMLAMGNLSQTDYNNFIQQPLTVVETTTAGKNRFPDFLDVVKRELHKVYKEDALKNQGLRIFTTLDPRVQLAADDAVSQSVATLKNKNTKKLKKLQAALVTANPETGELLAVVGSVGEFTGFNRALDAKRPVGSLLKPVVYLSALDSGEYNLASAVDDSPITINLADGKVWSPQNYDKTDHGFIPFHTALAKSYNQATVRLGMSFGVKRFIGQLHRLGIEQELPPYPSLFLGSANLSPMDMLSVYQVFASNGFRNPINSIRSVIDSTGKPLQRNSLNIEQSIDPANSYIINTALQGVIQNGTGRAALKLGKNLNLAGKTGTTNDYKDAWFAGYSGNYVSVVWVGNDDNTPIGLSGSSGALPVWINFMHRLNLTPVNLVQPRNVQWLWLDDGTGVLSDKRCPNAYYAPVKSDFLPTQASPCAVRLYHQANGISSTNDVLTEDSVSINTADNASTEATPTNSTDTDNNPQQAQPTTKTWFEKALDML